MAEKGTRLRVALVAGTLRQGGAEKQAVYIAKALSRAGVDVRVFCLTEGEFFENRLRSLGIDPVPIGRTNSTPVRLLRLIGNLIRFQPHIIQSTHFFTNLYVAIAGGLCGAQAIGSIRSDITHELAENGFWGPSLLHRLPWLLANSFAAMERARACGVDPQKIHLLSNVVELPEFDSELRRQGADLLPQGRPIAMTVSSLISAKRLDRFIAALALARRKAPGLIGVVVGDGPERSFLESTARDCGLLPEGVIFLGRQDSVPALLARADMLVLCSDHEGFPNVVLEAMCARIPVITTPAGDAGRLVQEAGSGFVVPFDDTQQLAERMVHLSQSSDVRQQFGDAGRKHAERMYGFDGLSDRLLTLYRSMAVSQNVRSILSAIPSTEPVESAALFQ